MATVIAVYEGKTIQEFELILLTSDPDAVARAIDALAEGGEVYARPVHKPPALRIVAPEEGSADRQATATVDGST